MCAHGLYSFVCKKVPGRPARHHALNDLVAQAMVSAGTPVIKKPSDLSRSDGKRPNGLSLVPSEEGKPLTWDVTVVCPLANSYVAIAARVAGSAAEGAAARKSAKYTVLWLCVFCTLVDCTIVPNPATPLSPAC